MQIKLQTKANGIMYNYIPLIKFIWQNECHIRNTLNSTLKHTINNN